MTGDCDEETAFAPHLIELARKNNAIIISPNYRLMPEANGDDMNNDIDWFWNNWFKGADLESIFKQNNREVEIDRTRILLSGESSGANLVIHSWLTQPGLGIKAIYLQYPQVMPYERAPESDPINVRGVAVPVADMRKHLAPSLIELIKLKQLEKCPIRSSSLPPEGALMNNYLPTSDKWKDAYGCPTAGERIVGGKEIPGTWPLVCIFHGDIDPRIPPKVNADFIKALKSNWGKKLESKVHLKIVTGMKHGGDMGMSLEGQDYLEDFARKIGKVW